MGETSALSGPVDGKDRAEIHARVADSGTSFLWAMRILPKERREAMYALYAFCREVDDIADEPGDIDERKASLDDWRREIDNLFSGKPAHAISRALKGPVTAYDLPREEFLAIVDGVEMDLKRETIAPSWQRLEAYIRGVAIAVGMISVRIFGETQPEARQVALTLGEGLQLTNILRDLAEDAADGRLYLPRELLIENGIETTEPAAVLAHPALPKVCEAIARRARAQFTETRALLGRCDRRKMRPCWIMMAVYERILDALERRGWRALDRPVRVPLPVKLWLALRFGLF